jgi:hypothetical protein
VSNPARRASPRPSGDGGRCAAKDWRAVETNQSPTAPELFASVAPRRIRIDGYLQFICGHLADAGKPPTLFFNTTLAAGSAQYIDMTQE